jgi:hypothetical protein
MVTKYFSKKNSKKKKKRFKKNIKILFGQKNKILSSKK